MKLASMRRGARRRRAKRAPAVSLPRRGSAKTPLLKPRLRRNSSMADHAPAIKPAEGAKKLRWVASLRYRSGCLAPVSPPVLRQVRSLRTIHLSALNLDTLFYHSLTSGPKRGAQSGLMFLFLGKWHPVLCPVYFGSLQKQRNPELPYRMVLHGLSGHFRGLSGHFHDLSGHFRGLSGHFLSLSGHFSFYRATLSCHFRDGPAR